MNNGMTTLLYLSVGILLNMLVVNLLNQSVATSHTGDLVLQHNYDKCAV